MNSTDEFVVLKRDCEARLIPSGDPITLIAGEPVTITQALGGSFTVVIHGNMARIDGSNADALGLEGQAPANRNGEPQPQTQSSSAEATPSGPVDEDAIMRALRTCYDPEIPVNIVDLGLVYDLQIAALPEGGNRVEVKMTLTAPGCGMGPVLQQDVAEKINCIPGVTETDVILVWDPPWNREMLSDAAKLELGMM